MRHFLLFGSLLFLFSCNSIRVYTDHDSKIDFSTYSSFAYIKPEIDKVAISDLDKRRILKAIDMNLEIKGFTKSKTPNLLVSFSTKATEKIYVNNFGWSPWFWGPNYSSVNTDTEGILFINFFDATSKQLIWQGKGLGMINEFTKNRDERIAFFVAEIISKYPPEIK